MNPILIFLIGLLIPASKPCLSAMTAKLSADLPACLISLPTLEPKIKFANFFLRSDDITKALSLFIELKPFLPHLDYLLGIERPTTYLVLLQNDREMRANGGFFGSYAKIILTPQTKNPVGDSSWDGGPYPGLLPGGITIRFQDIYVPDGALVGHVDPPAPIQTAFKQGWFRLRDSDWEPDFSAAAKTIRWFFEKGGEINPDFLITLNLTTIEKIMAVVGEVEVPEFNFRLTSDNLYTLLQNQAEINFFPGSTQKQNVLTAVGTALTKKLENLPPRLYLKIARVLVNQLNHTNLLANSTNPDIQKIIEEKHWAGQISNIQCQISNCLNDTVLLVETNLGANKANCCVDRKTTHTISHTPYAISHLINLTFTNNSPLENPLPPRFYGGNYISYLRYYLPENATNIRLTAQPTLPKTLSQYPTPFDGLSNKNWKFSIVNFPLSIFKEIGFFHLTAAGTKSAVQLSYELPLDDTGFSSDGNPAVPPGTVDRTRDSSQVEQHYQLTLLKQNGMESSPAEINLLGKSSSTNLETDFTLYSPL